MAARGRPEVRSGLLQWVNEVTGMTYTSVEECRTGVPFLMALHAFHPQRVPLGRVTFSAQYSHQFLHNYKILQEVMEGVHLKHPIDVERLAKGSKPEILALLAVLKSSLGPAPRAPGSTAATEQQP
eukprot:RCo039808